MWAGSDVRNRHEIAPLGRRQARGRLVEQDEARRAGERERDLELPLLAIGQLADQAVLVAGQMHGLDQLSAACISASSARGRSSEKRFRETPRQAR